MSGDHADVEPSGGGDLVLGPDEIVNYPLRKATRGYRTADVDDLLDQLAVQTQDLLSRLQRLEDERDLLRQELAEASEGESLLKKTLVTAQRTADASVAEARAEANELRRRARELVEELLAEAAEQAHELRETARRRARADEADIRRYRRDVVGHVEALRTFAADHRARLAHHLELQQDRLAEMDMPDTPQLPELADDEILDTEIEEIDVKGLVADILGDQDSQAADGGASDDDAPSDAAHDAVADDVAPDGSEQDWDAARVPPHAEPPAGDAETEESLFGS